MGMRHVLKPKTPSASARFSYISRSEKYDNMRGKRDDVAYTSNGNMPDFAIGDPYYFWRLADENEAVNSRVCLQLELNLPRELKLDQQIEAVEYYIEMLCKKAGEFPYSYAIHHDKKGKNPHVHLMLSERTLDYVERPAEQFFKRANKKFPENGGAVKSRWWHQKHHVFWSRACWAESCNEVLKKHGYEARFDARTKTEQADEALKVGDLLKAVLMSTHTEKHENWNISNMRKQLKTGNLLAEATPSYALEMIVSNDKIRSYNNELRDWARLASHSELEDFLKLDNRADYDFKLPAVNVSIEHASTVATAVPVALIFEPDPLVEAAASIESKLKVEQRDDDPKPTVASLRLSDLLAALSQPDKPVAPESVVEAVAPVESMLQIELFADDLLSADSQPAAAVPVAPISEPDPLVEAAASIESKLKIEQRDDDPKPTVASLRLSDLLAALSQPDKPVAPESVVEAVASVELIADDLLSADSQTVAAVPVAPTSEPEPVIEAAASIESKLKIEQRDDDPKPTVASLRLGDLLAALSQPDKPVAPESVVEAVAPVEPIPQVELIADDVEYSESIFRSPSHAVNIETEVESKSTLGVSSVIAVVDAALVPNAVQDSVLTLEQVESEIKKITLQVENDKKVLSERIRHAESINAEFNTLKLEHKNMISNANKRNFFKKTAFKVASTAAKAVGITLKTEMMQFKLDALKITFKAARKECEAIEKQIKKLEEQHINLIALDVSEPLRERKRLRDEAYSEAGKAFTAAHKKVNRSQLGSFDYLARRDLEFIRQDLVAPDYTTEDMRALTLRAIALIEAVDKELDKISQRALRADQNSKPQATKQRPSMSYKNDFKM